MKKTMIYGAVLLILIGIVALVFLQEEKVSPEEAAKDFKVENVEDIERINITHQNGESISLVQDDGNWMLNGEFPAREGLLTLLLEAVTQMEPYSPVPDSAKELVLRDMVGNSVRVEIYTGDDEAELVYYVGSPNASGDGSYMIKEIDGEMSASPYVVYIPGFRGYLSSRFVTNTNEWKSKSVYALLPAEIQSISIDFVEAEQEESFTLTRDGSDFELKNNGNVYSGDNINPTRLSTFMMNFEQISLEDYEIQVPDTVLQIGKTMPYVNIDVTDTDDFSRKVKIYYMPLYGDGSLIYDSLTNVLKDDPDKYLAEIEGIPEMVTVQKYNFDKILPRAKHFIQ